MNGLPNPYADARHGLDLPDPVEAFFAFCSEREGIRRRREGGAPAPWSEDPIFQRGRFLNVFREDDRGSQAIVRFAGPVAEDLPTLVHALFFARWCNRQSTLDRLTAVQLADPAGLRRALDALPSPPWCNVTAYPVEPVRWAGSYHSRFDTATGLLGQINDELTEAIAAAGGDVVGATRAVNALLGMVNDFPIFMAVMDLAWFRPDVIDPASHVPTGIGAVTFLDLLQAHLGLADHQQTAEKMIALQPKRWPGAKRALRPIDVEYLACECRKYFSYVNGTKRFEGKNVFEPGRSARLTIDIPESDGAAKAACEVGADVTQTQILVVAGVAGIAGVAEVAGIAGTRALPKGNDRKDILQKLDCGD